MKPSDEQLREIGRAGWRACVGSDCLGSTALAMGRAAFEASCKIALAPFSDKEMNAVVDGKNHPTYWTPQEHGCINRILANRLRSLTAPEKDEHIEAAAKQAYNAYGDWHCWDKADEQVKERWRSAISTALGKADSK